MPVVVRLLVYCENEMMIMMPTTTVVKMVILMNVHVYQNDVPTVRQHHYAVLNQNETRLIPVS